MQNVLKLNSLTKVVSLLNFQRMDLLSCHFGTHYPKITSTKETRNCTYIKSTLLSLNK